MHLRGDPSILAIVLASVPNIDECQIVHREGASGHVPIPLDPFANEFLVALVLSGEPYRSG